MAKYAIWNKQDPIYTLVGECIPASEYLAKHAWAQIPGVRVIVGGGNINGTMFLEFDATKEFYVKQGMEIPEGATDEEILALMEAWDSRVIEPEVTAEERIAAALEYQNLVNM